MELKLVNFIVHFLIYNMSTFLFHVQKRLNKNKKSLFILQTAFNSKFFLTQHKYLLVDSY